MNTFKHTRLNGLVSFVAPVFSVYMLRGNRCGIAI